MCELPECGSSCKGVGRAGAAVGVLAGSVLVWQVAPAVLAPVVPVVRALAVAAVVAVAGVLAAAAVLGVLGLRRRRRLLTGRVLAHAGVTAAAIPAAGVPLALAAGAQLFTGPLFVAGIVVLSRFAWAVIVKPTVAMRRSGAYEAVAAHMDMGYRVSPAVYARYRRGELAAPPKAIGAPVVYDITDARKRVSRER